MALDAIVEHPAFWTVYLNSSVRRVNIRPRAVDPVEIRGLVFTSTGLPGCGNVCPADPACSCSDKIDFILGSYTTADSTTRPDSIGVRIDSIDASALNSRFYGGAVGIGGGISVGELVYLYCQQDTGEVIARTTPARGASIEVGEVRAKITIANGDLALLRVRDATSPYISQIGSFGEPSVQVLNGNVDTINVQNDIKGQILVPNGLIRNMQAGGQIQIYDNDPAIGVFRGTGIQTRSGIDRLTANSIANTNIIANLNGTGNIGLLQTTQGFTNGSLVANNLLGAGGGTFGLRTGNVATNSAVNFRGDATEPIILNGGLASGTTINISGSLAGSNAFVQLPNQSRLGGQIIINSKDGLPANTPNGTWTAPVYVGNGSVQNPAYIELSPLPHYEQKSADLGGGAVGLVPFGLYRADSTKAMLDENIPLTRGVYLDSGFRTTNVADRPSIAFYGPVKVVNSPDPQKKQPFTVVISNETNTINMNVSHLFRVITDPTNNRMLRLEYLNAQTAYLLSGRYTITNNATGEQVVCDINEPNIPVNMLGGLQLDIGRDCNGNGELDSLEIANDVTLDIDPADGVLDSCPLNGMICVADLNQDMYVDDADFVIFAAAYNEVTSPFGDFTGDFATNDEDFVIFAAFYNKVDCLAPWPN